MKTIIGKTYEGRGIIVHEDTEFRDCIFRNITMDNGWCGDGVQCEGHIQVNLINCIFDNTGVDPANSDEAVSGFRDGCSIYMENCTIRNWGKGILIGNGDWTKEEEGDLYLHCRGCDFIGVGRRLPFIRYGTALMEECNFVNWGVPGSYDVKGNCVKANLGAKCIFKDCKWVQHKFHFDWKDVIHQFSPDDVYGLENAGVGKLLFTILCHPIKFLKSWMPGCMKGVECNTGSKATYSGCTKNHWWIRLSRG